VTVLSTTTTTLTIQSGYDPGLEAGGPRVGDDVAQGNDVAQANDDYLQRITAVNGNTLTVANTTNLTTGTAYVAFDGASSDQEPIIRIARSAYAQVDNSTSILLTADAVAGTNTIHLQSVSGLAAGDLVLLDETSQSTWSDDPTGTGPTGAKIAVSGAWSPKGSWTAGTAPTVPDVVLRVHQPTASGDDGIAVPSTGGPTAANQYASTGSGNDMASAFCRQDRFHNELKLIASVDAAAKTVTFDSPIHATYRFGGPVLSGAMKVASGHYAEIARYTATNPSGPATPIRNVGVEQLAMMGGNAGNLRVQAAYGVWIQNVDASVWGGENISFNDCLRCELRDSYLHDAAIPHPGGVGYAIDFDRGATEILIENVISVRANKVIEARSSGAGSVVAYNYMDQQFIDYIEGFQEVGLNGSHMAAGRLILFEGNQGSNWDSDATHGPASFHTVFRNWLTGFRAPFTNPISGHLVDDQNELFNGPLRCAGTMTYTYGMNFVGNVLGVKDEMGRKYPFTSSDGFLYESVSTANVPSMLMPGIWMLGWNPGNGNQADAYANDPYSMATLIRDGNWDWLQARQSWHGLGGSGLGQVTPPPVATLPASLYLTSRPLFMDSAYCGGSCTWPWVDPTAGATFTLPAKARYDAGTPNLVH
jgi:hypothetical protein